MIYLCPCVPVTKHEWVNLFIYLFIFIIITLKHVSNHSVIFKFHISLEYYVEILQKTWTKKKILLDTKFYFAMFDLMICPLFN